LTYFQLKNEISDYIELFRMKRIGGIYKKKRGKQGSQCEITLSQDL